MAYGVVVIKVLWAYGVVVIKVLWAYGVVVIKVLWAYGVMVIKVLWAYDVVVSMFDFHRSDRVQIPVVAVKFHNVYDYNMVRHPWQENHKPRVHPSHVREIE